MLVVHNKFRPLCMLLRRMNSRIDFGYAFVLANAFFCCLKHVWLKIMQ